MFAHSFNTKGAAALGIIAFSSVSLTGLASRKYIDDNGYRFKIMSCDSGAVDIVANEINPNNVQAIVQNDDIARYFAISMAKAQPTRPLPDMSAVSKFVLDGYSNNSVDSAQNFGGFKDNWIHKEQRVYRKGNGLMVELFATFQISVGEGGATTTSPKQKVADWYFNDCISDVE